MIGKISGIDWSGAPKDATHVVDTGIGGLFYKWRIETNSWFYFGSFGWSASESFASKTKQQLVSTFGRNTVARELISKEEDLGMKQVKSIQDVEVGMFLKDREGVIRLVIPSTPIGWMKTYNITHEHAKIWINSEFVENFTSWSYTYAGEYTPIIKETAKEKAIKAAKEEITQAQQALDNAKTKLDQALASQE